MKLPCIRCETLVFIPPKYRRKGMKETTCYECFRKELEANDQVIDRPCTVGDVVEELD